MPDTTPAANVATIPAGSPAMYLHTLALDLLLAERSSRAATSSPEYWNRSTLAYTYGQATRWFDLEPVRIGASHLDTVANAVERVGACACCLMPIGHDATCPVPF